MMALQTSKVVILVGAGYTSTVLLKNGKLSDLLGELQSLVKGWEKNGDLSDTDLDYSDAIAAQVRRLAMEVRQLASARQVTVSQMNQMANHFGNTASLVVPVAALGALGYLYMWWKGLSFSDLMYVTKRNMENAVSNLTKHLEHVSEVLAATKRHLAQRIENLDGKLDDQIEMAKLIKNEVTGVHADLSQIGYDLNALQRMVSGLNGKICSLEDKQDLATTGVLYLCNFVDGRKMKMLEVPQEQLQLSGKSCGYLTSSETPSLKGLKEIVDTLVPEDANMSTTEGSVQDSSDKLDDVPGPDELNEHLVEVIIK